MKRTRLQHPAARSGRRCGAWVPLLALALAGSGCLGKRRPPPRDEKTAAASGAPADRAASRVIGPEDVDDSLSKLVTGERKQVGVREGDPMKGSDRPLVTIVEFSDFQCPFCSRLAGTLEQVLADDDDVRLVFKQFPLPMHPNAEPAARAALAAHDQGKFWAMHDQLFAHQQALGPDDLKRYATEIGLDLAAFDKRLSDESLQAKVSADEDEGKALEVRSTPTFFVNGRQVMGAKPLEEILGIVAEEKALAKKLVAAGSKPEEVYARIMKAASPGKGAVPARDPTHKRGEASKQTNYAIPVGEGRPTRGPANALVTIVEYGAMTCDDCRAVQPTVKSLLSRHPDVRFVFRNLPPEGDNTALGAALTALAAARQGKFWEMQDKLLGFDGDLDFETVVGFAGDIGLDVEKFKQDMRDRSLRESIDVDRAGVDKVRGTAEAPMFFVNGRILTGNPSVADFEALIDEERRKAEAFVAAHPEAKSDPYEAMRRTWRGYDIVEQAVKEAAPAG